MLPTAVVINTVRKSLISTAVPADNNVLTMISASNRFSYSSSAVAQKTSTATVKSTASTSQITPKQVIDNYLTALGGKAKLEAVKSTIIENTINAQGMEINSTTKKMGNKFKSVQSVMGQEMTQVFDGEPGKRS